MLRKQLTDIGILKTLWLGLAITSSLFGVAFFRLPVLRFDVAMPVFFMVTITWVGILILTLRRKVVMSIQYVQPLLTLSFCLLLWSFIGLYRAIDMVWAIEEFVKLTIGLMWFWCMLLPFPREQKFLEQFIILVLWSSAILATYLIYKYAYEFNATFLGIRLEHVSRAGKNQLSWFLSLVVLYSFIYLWVVKRNVMIYLRSIILVVAWIYMGSRAAWITVVAGLGYAVIAMHRQNVDKKFKKTLIILLGTAVMIRAVLWLMSQFIDLSEISRRFLYLFRPDEVRELHSYEIRLQLLKDVWNNFLNNPIIGVGFANTRHFLIRFTHNDYAAVLLELGLIGEILFLGILVFVWKKVNLRIPRTPVHMSWTSLASRAALTALLISLLFTNTYTSVHFWMFLGLIYVSVDIEGY